MCFLFTTQCFCNTNNSATGDKYNEFDIEVKYNRPSETEPHLQVKSVSVTENGSSEICPDNGYDGIEQINLSVNVSGAEITDGIVVTARDSGGYATAIDFYGTVINNQQFYNLNTSTGAWTKCTSISAKDAITSIRANGLASCGALTAIPSEDTVQTIGGYCCMDCKGITSVNFPELTSISESAFMRCANMISFSAPKLRSISWNNVFYGCSSLLNVNIGSIGYGVTTVSASAFAGDTQSGLTITLFTTGNYADTILANARNGATNAVIIIKASADTEYRSTSYVAGETIVTSEVA